MRLVIFVILYYFIYLEIMKQATRKIILLNFVLIKKEIMVILQATGNVGIRDNKKSGNEREIKPVIVILRSK